MKKVLTTLLITLVIAASVVMMTQPEIPISTCTENNPSVSKLCLSYIPKHYDEDHLSYLGHTRAWLYRSLDKLGINLGQQQTRALVKYSSFEDAVNCYLTASADASLNMTLTPIEFDTRYQLIAREYGIE